MPWSAIGPGEHFFGLHDKEQDVDFIPAFNSREDAADCLLTLPRERAGNMRSRRYISMN